MPFHAALLDILGPTGLISDPAALAQHNLDWRGRYRGQAKLMAMPASTEQTVCVMRCCHAYRVPVVPQSGNTSLCGGSVPGPGGNELILNVSRMQRLRELDGGNGTLTCDAGMVLATLQQQAAAAGFLFPLSIASEGSAQVGGVISTNAGGIAVLRYGSMRSMVLGLEVVLPDGRLWSGLRALRKDNTGYDLKQWFIGAEGTLGVITAATLRLFPQPRAHATAWVALPSPQHAVDLLRYLQHALGERISSFELVSQVALTMVLKHLPHTRPPLATPSPWAVLIQLDDAEARPLEGVLAQILEQALDRGLITDASLAQSLSQARALWYLREQISEAQRLEGVSIKHDISVPVSHIPEFILRATASLEQAFPGIRLVCFGHVGDGNLHFNLSKPDALENTGFIGQTEAVNRIVHDQVMTLGGSISAEHGIGQLKIAELQRYKDPLELELMRSLKQALDPLGLMNPGKLFSSSSGADGLTLPI